MFLAKVIMKVISKVWIRKCIYNLLLSWTPRKSKGLYGQTIPFTPEIMLLSAIQIIVHSYTIY